MHFMAAAALKQGTVDVHALVTARKSENGEHTLPKGHFKRAKHPGIMTPKVRLNAAKCNPILPQNLH